MQFLAQAVASAPVESVRGLSWIDWVLIACYGVGMLWLGVWCAQRQENVKAFFVAGGKLGSFAVGGRQRAGPPRRL